MRILLIEEHKLLARVLKQGLEEDGFAVDVSHEGEDADYLARSAEYDVVIFDLMPRNQDSLKLLQHLRRAAIQTRVLVLTAPDSMGDKVQGLNLGADDWLTTPFQFEELLVRLRALVRRGHPNQDRMIRDFDLDIDTVARTPKRAGKTTQLTPRAWGPLR